MYDYIVIGAGSAGCVMANRLSANSDNKVLLLEAGKKDTSPFIHMPPGVGLLLNSKKYNWGFDTAPEPHLNNRELYWPRGKVLGGSSSINGMIYNRGHARDYDQWRQLGNVGWSYEEVLPYFKKSINQERGADKYHGTGGPLNVKDSNASIELHQLFIDAGVEAGHKYNPDFNGAEQEGIGPYQVTKIGGKRCSAAKAFLTPILDRENLTVITEARILAVALDGKVTRGVKYHKAGKYVDVEVGKEVILCAGAVQSPQILQLSGIGDPVLLDEFNITVNHALPGVGQNLQDHLDVVVQHHCTRPDMTLDRAAKLHKALPALIRYLLFESGPGTESPLEAGGFVKSREDLEVPDLQLHFIPGFMIDHGRQRGPGPGMCIHVCHLHPQSRGEVTLRSADPFDDPLIKANYLSVEADLDVLVEGVKIVRKIYKTSVLAPYLGEEYAPSKGRESDAEIREFIRENAETLYHPVGTCKMGSDPMAVVDDQLRVHGIEKLRVVDASIMPTVVGGNTNAPTIMIAEKAADLVLA
ncbi:MAG: choline dehydrogenase [Gammaproteobacteria bacterium]|nr:choline dehydrogenase [Gammaproteobacteria bacterium]